MIRMLRHVRKVSLASPTRTSPSVVTDLHALDFDPSLRAVREFRRNRIASKRLPRAA